MTADADSARISPTAHYTSYVWFLHGLSHPALTTWLGATLHAALVPLNDAYDRLADHPGLDSMLLARHRVIDHLLQTEVAAGRVGQVLEVAAGLSGRGYRFTHTFPELRYVEADLPDMVAYKRRALERAGLRGRDHTVVEIDALEDTGPASLPAVAAAHLDPARGTALVTEGLLGYFERATVEAMWRRFAAALRGFPRSLYLADLHLAADVTGLWAAEAFRTGLSLFARGAVHVDFETAEDTVAALRAAGFREAALHRPGDVASVDVPDRARRHLVCMIEARA